MSTMGETEETREEGRKKRRKGMIRVAGTVHL
jgi:hypothetical protein